MTWPIRRFKVQSFKIPPMPYSSYARAKQNATSEKELSECREQSAKHDRLLLAPAKCCPIVPNGKPICDSCQEEGNYEDCETSGMPEVFTDSRTVQIPV